MSSIITLILLFLLPLIFFQVGILQFESLKVVCAEVLIEALVVWSLIKRVKLTFDRQMVVSLLLFGLTIIDIVFFRTQVSLFGNVFRLQGIFLFWHLLLFSLFSSNVRLPERWQDLSLLAVSIMAGLTFWGGFNANGRLTGPLGEPNALAAALVFLGPLILYSRINRFIKMGFLGLDLILILLSGSRAGILAVVIQSIFLVLNRILKLKLINCVIICLAFLLLTLYFPIGIGGGKFENRSEIWRVAFMSGLKSPIFGNGFGNVEVLLHKEAIELDSNVQYQYVDSSHNFILDLWIEGGVMGIFLMSALVFFSIRGLIINRKILELILFLGVFETMMFNPASVVTLIQFWWLIGQGFAKNSVRSLDI